MGETKLHYLIKLMAVGQTQNLSDSTIITIIRDAEIDFYNYDIFSNLFLFDLENKEDRFSFLKSEIKKAFKDRKVLKLKKGEK